MQPLTTPPAGTLIKDGFLEHSPSEGSLGAHRWEDNSSILGGPPLCMYIYVYSVDSVFLGTLTNTSYYSDDNNDSVA